MESGRSHSAWAVLAVQLSMIADGLKHRPLIRP
jgi:hypothetical protein